MKIREATYEEMPNDIYETKKNFAREFFSKSYEHHELPEKLKIPVYIKYRLVDGEIFIGSHPINLKSNDPSYKSSCLGRFIIDVPINAISYNQALQEMVACMREQKKTIQAETQQKIDGIDGKINKLLTIEHKPEVTNDAE